MTKSRRLHHHTVYNFIVRASPRDRDPAHRVGIVIRVDVVWSKSLGPRTPDPTFSNGIYSHSVSRGTRTGCGLWERAVTSVGAERALSTVSYRLSPHPRLGNTHAAHRIIAIWSRFAALFAAIAIFTTIEHRSRFGSRITVSPFSAFSPLHGSPFDRPRPQTLRLGAPCSQRTARRPHGVQGIARRPRPVNDQHGGEDRSTAPW